MIRKTLTSKTRTTAYAERMPTASASPPNARGKARIAVPDASVARAPAWTVFPFDALIASERIKGYRLATPKPVRKSPLRPMMVLSVLQKSRKPIPATTMETVTTARVENR